MVQIAGKYENTKNENLVPFLVAIGIPEQVAKAGNEEILKLEFEVDGKKIVVKSSSPVTPTTTYIVGEVVDEIIGPSTYKTTVELNGDVLTATAVKGDVTFIRSFKFSATETVLSLSGTIAGNVTAKRFFKRV